AAEAAAIIGGADQPRTPAPLPSEEAGPAGVLGAPLHDAGKIGRGSPVRVGEDIAGGALDHPGARPAAGDRVRFLVGHPVRLSDTATRRDVGEEDVVLRVARAVGNERRLAMLWVLTVADATATGPAASSEWRRGLVRELVARTARVLDRGLVREEDADVLAR